MCLCGSAGWARDFYTDREANRNATFHASSLFLFDFDRNFFMCLCGKLEKGDLSAHYHQTMSFTPSELDFLNISPPTSQVRTENTLSDSS